MQKNTPPEQVKLENEALGVRVGRNSPAKA
jgi:hypothetical protein